MSPWDLLLITVYIICVTYVLQKAFQEIDSRVKIQLDTDEVNKQLEEQNVKDIVAIGFKFKPAYHLDDLNNVTQLPLVITNKSQNHKVSVNWDESSISNFKKQAGRSIRVTSGMVDPPTSQATSTILPGQTIVENLSDEKLKSPLNSIPYKKSPLVSERLLKLAALSGNKFHLQLAFNVSDQTADPKDTKKQNFCVVKCPLGVEKVHWAKAADLILRPPK
ncbi:hypothetical protein [Lyngbya aestuarii]|uniref:hypothetical protein n=1 Tax=Lyngbya aestuarii TaxID=118322 RepID=UPI00403D783C